jgi:glyoxylase-like metal-dependent hydrolase (beta-lactamase superfamily II)
MQHTKHGSYLHKLTKFIGFNNYLLEEDDGLTLIDTNLGNNTAAIVKIAQQIGKPVRRLVVTHAHSDHAGAVDALLAVSPETEFIASERSARMLTGDLTLEPDEPQSSLAGGYVTVNAKPARVVNDGDMICSLQVISAPGHSPDHIALLDTRDQTLIAGDAYATQAGIAVSGVVRWLFPFPALATWDKPTALATARNLVELKLSRLAVGHGRVVENPETAMRAAIAEAEQKFGA